MSGTMFYWDLLLPYRKTLSIQYALMFNYLNFNSYTAIVIYGALVSELDWLT